MRVLNLNLPFKDFIKEFDKIYEEGIMLEEVEDLKVLLELSGKLDHFLKFYKVE